MSGEIVETSRIGTDVLRVEWRIRNFSSIPVTNYYPSPDFIFGDKRWYMSLDPCERFVWLNLCRRDQGPDETLHFSVGIRGSGGVEKSRGGEKEFSNACHYYAWHDFCSRKELVEHRTRLMPDDVLVIACDLKRPGAAREEDFLQTSDQNVLKSGEDTEITLKKQGVEELQRSLKRLLAGGDGSDCLIKVRGREFPAHKTILRARSPVFQAMFTHDMAEKQSNTVTMEDCDPETFPDFLEHVYTGSVEMISDGNVFSLYAASEKYDLPTLKTACAEFVKKNLSVASFCDAIMLAITHDDKELMERATEFFCNNTLDIIKTAKWQIFLAENPTVGNELHIKKLSK